MSWECISYWVEHHPGLASWVQAVGAIISIWGAFEISRRQQNAQLKKAEKEIRDRSHRLRSTYVSLTKSQASYLDGLCKVLDNTLAGTDGSGIRDYLSSGHGLLWGPHIDALKEFSIVELEQMGVDSLIELKAGAEFARSICDKLAVGGLAGINYLPDLEQLESLRDKAKAEYQRLSHAT